MEMHTEKGLIPSGGWALPPLCIVGNRINFLILDVSSLVCLSSFFMRGFQLKFFHFQAFSNSIDLENSE